MTSRIEVVVFCFARALLDRWITKETSALAQVCARAFAVKLHILA